ncbi:MAG: hypothetical protein WC967_14645 [Balneolaceae bacterium]
MLRLLLLLILFTYSCSGSQKVAKDEMLEMAVDEFIEFERLYYESIESEKKPSPEKIKEQTKYKGELNSPFKKSHFYVFSYEAFEPALEIIVVKNSSTEVLNDYFEAEREVLFSETFLEKINSLIDIETSFSKDQLVELSKFMFASYHSQNSLIKLKTWESIPNDSENSIPDSLKSIISPFVKEEMPNKLRYHGYVWEGSTSFLYKVSFDYLKQNNEVEVRAENLGSVGTGLISL